MAQTKVRREIMTTHFTGTKTTADDTTPVVTPIEGDLAGAYTEKRLTSTLERANVGYNIHINTISYTVAEYEMSLEDFVKYGTKK